MNRIILGTLVATAIAAPAFAELRETTSTTTYTGTVADVSPSSSTIVLDTGSGPESKYSFNEKTVWVDAAGNTVKWQTVEHQPVTVFYEKQGDAMVVTKVVAQNGAAPVVAPSTVEKTTTTTTHTLPAPPPAVVEKRTTTTTTEGPQ